MQSVTDIRTPIFNVHIVPPLETLPPVPEKKLLPAIKKEPPVIKKKRHRPPEKSNFASNRKPLESTLEPETLYGKGLGLSPKTADNVKAPGDVKQTGEGKPKKERDDIAAAPKKNSRTFSPEKDGPSFVPGPDLFDEKTIEKYARRGPPAQRGLSFDTADFKHRGYLRMLKERIESIWKYPKEAAERGISGDLYLVIVINRDGTLDELELLRTSGFVDLDEAAIKALKKVFPWSPLPKDYKEDKLRITGHFIYIYGNTYAM